MNEAISRLKEAHIVANDGELGVVVDFFLDSKTGEIDYLVVETGEWLDSIRLVIPYRIMKLVDQRGDQYRIPLSRDRVIKRGVKGTIGGYIPYGRTVN